jgi:hypothetical protein
MTLRFKFQVLPIVEWFQVHSTLKCIYEIMGHEALRKI